MTLGVINNDLYRARTEQIIPAPPTKRAKCAQCGKHQSIGQIGPENICITCKPQGRNFRRGDIAEPIAKFKETPMLDEQKMLDLIASEPLIRTKELMDRLDCDIDQVDEALAPHLASGRIVPQDVRGPTGLRAIGYKIARP